MKSMFLIKSEFATIGIIGSLYKANTIAVLTSESDGFATLSKDGKILAAWKNGEKVEDNTGG